MIVSPNDLIFCICFYIWMANKFAKGSFHFRCTKNAFFIFRVPKVGSFCEGSTKYLMSIWTNPFFIILDHILLTIDQSFHVKCFLYTSAEKDKLPPIQLERGEIWTTSAWYIALYFFKKIFPSAQVLISSEIYKEFCKIPHLAITGHAPPPLFWPHFEAGLNNSKKSKRCKTFALHPNLCPSNHTNQ